MTQSKRLPRRAAPSFALVADGNAGIEAAAGVLARSAGAGTERIAVICTNASAALAIQQAAEQALGRQGAVEAVVVRNLDEAAVAVALLRPLRIGLQLTDPLAFAARLQRPPAVLHAAA